MSTTKIVVALLVMLAGGIGIDLYRDDSVIRPLWRQAVKPGDLSQSHAFLSNNCVACHTPVKGVEPTLCISCHADNTALLQRQPTAFHADVQVCSGCHLEHQGTLRMPTTMDHSLLAEIGHASPEGAGADPTHRMNAGETMLDCASCHVSKDRHQGLLGTDCVQCHATKQWTIAAFVHPSARSTECSQCHLPPPPQRVFSWEVLFLRVQNRLCH